jgi:hypothetical protein
MELSVPNGCVDTGFGPAIRGWCCRPNEDCYTFTSTSDVVFGSCSCPDDPEGRGDTECGDECCAKGQICVDDRSGKHCKPPCVKGRHYDQNSNCVCDRGATCRNGCCPEGQECLEGRCASPADTSGFFKNLTKNFGEFSGSDTGNQAAGSRAGGSNYFRLGHAAAGPGATPVRSALLLLAAVNARGAAAAIAFTDLHVDRGYRRRVVAARPRLPKLAGTPGFDPGAARALDALLAAEAKAFAQIAASATALARSRGALRAHNSALARKQALAAGSFASAAAKALRGVPSLRRRAAAALRAAGVAEVNAGVIDVAALQAAVKASGIPADLTGLLRGLGMTGDDLKRARQAFAALTPSGGPALIVPLSDPGRNRTITQLAGELAKYARSTRRSPIRRSRVEPMRVRAPRR